MLKSIKKAVAVLLALTMMVGTAACSSDKSWAAKKDSQTIPIGAYVYCLFAAYQNASSKVTDTSKPVLEQKIENKDAKTWIQDNAMSNLKLLLATDEKMKELNLTLTEEEKKQVDSLTSSQWGKDGKMFEGYGISQSSFKYAYAELNQKNNKIFQAIYGKNGKSAVSDADLKAYFEKNYTDMSLIAKPLFKYDATKQTSSEFTKDELAKAKKEFDDYVADINSGKKTVAQAADAYKTSAKLEQSPLTPSTSILNEESGYPADFIKAVKAMKNGEAKTIEVSNYYVLVVKHDITKKTEAQIGTESTKNSVLIQMKGKEFTDLMKAAADKITGYTFNEKTINSYHPSMFAAASK